MRRLGRWVWGRVPGTKPGSKWRNLFSYFAILLIALLLAEAIAAQYGAPLLTERVAGPALIVLVVVYFLVVVVGVIYLTSRHFRPSPARLARDTLISIALTILAFAVFYRNAGITLTGTCPEPFRPSDAIYFSAVTFSTLGYGDFRPCPGTITRLTAAFHAIFGNLHLGLIVGAAFFFAQGGNDSDEDRDDDNTEGRGGDDG
ncbi:potassium channel family protein [Poseidonocella sedimentorum]|uniref:Ion channel n=1 Tax=Poseidonocella sedimentorum TaxID=871652 RepID=A0A1I6EK14_9RHOB|nr:potassium channel family protein [Poseidonocella sedimentorum]SFR18089.1 Ion channel [Poseidonocella sedimentorum]